jgi:hypothetical protein
MSKSSEWSQTYPCSPDTLLGVVTNPEFHIARSSLLENPAARVEERLRTAARLELAVHCVEYAKGVTGVDRSKTETSVTVYRFDLDARRGEYTYEGSQGKRVRVWGDLAVTPEGSGARLTQQFHVEIKIPLVGGTIEGMVLKETAKFWPRYERLVGEFVSRAGRP